MLKFDINMSIVIDKICHPHVVCDLQICGGRIELRYTP